MTRAAHLLRLARALGIKIATAESCTGGLIIGALTEVPGSSDVVDRGYITYSNAAKMDMLGVGQKTLDEYGAVSEEVAFQMTDGAAQSSGAALAIAVTGIAGPGGSEHKPEGRVCFGVSFNGEIQLQTVEFGPLGRNKVRTATVEHAINLMIDALESASHKD